jgi:hypothetical protein
MFRIRKPSLRKRIAARTSVKRMIRNNLGIKAPRGMGLLTNPKKAIYNRMYNRTNIDPFNLPKKRKGCACCPLFVLLFISIPVTTAIIITKILC